MTAMTRRSRWLITLLAATSLMASACANDAEDEAGSGGGAEATASDEPIVIGGTLGLTGAFSGPSAGYQVAYDYWLEQINEDGGLLGRPVELKIYDDESNPTTAQQLFQTLINEDKVDLLLAPYTTAVGGAVVPITERAGKVLFDAGFVSKELHQNSKFLVSSWPYQEPEYPLPFFEYLKTLPDDQKPKTLAVVTAQNPFTLVARDGFDGEGGVLNYAKEAGIEVVYNEEYATTATDLSALVQGAKASGAEALVALSLPNDGALIARTVNQADYRPTLYCQCGSQVTTLPNWPDLGPAGINVFASTTAWPTQDNEGIAELAEHFQSELKVPALPAYGAVGYSILQVLQQAVEGTESLDQQKIRDYIGENEFKTAVGDLNYNEDGTVEFGALLLQYQEGGNQVIWPEDVATGEAVVPFRP
jgi:branched-chain amino acid transport system substrate-binding protein